MENIEQESQASPPLTTELSSTVSTGLTFDQVKELMAILVPAPGLTPEPKPEPTPTPEPKPGLTPEPKPESTPTPEPAAPYDGQIAALNSMVRDLLIQAHQVPEELRPLLPEDNAKAKEFLASPSYASLKTKLTGQAAPEKPAEGTPPPPENDSKNPATAKPKTFGEITDLPSMISDLMKGV